MRRVILITGASSGIGWSSALAFTKRGDLVAGVARRADRLQALSEAITPLDGDFLPLVGDVTRCEDVEGAVAQTLAKWGRIDVLIVNAGIGQRGALADSDWQDIETLLRLNIDGALYSIRAVLPTMRQQKRGHIITISSVAASLVSPYAASYAASKAFLSSIATSLRLEVEADNIFVSDILVGRTDTEFNEKRLGEGARVTSNLPTMSADTVAQALITVVEKPRNTVILRFFDRLIVLGNRLFPALMGRLAKKQYK